MNRPRRVGILIFDDVEVLDFCGPFEVFSVAAKQSDPPGFEVVTIGEKSPVTACNGLSVNPKQTLADTPPIDVLLVPGGVGTRREINNQPLVEWIRATAADAELVLSVCTGALLLGKAGLLDGLQTTTHHVAYDLLRELVPTATVHEDQRFVDNGRVITSAGISAGIDMSLHVVRRLLGDDVAKSTVRHMEYDSDLWSSDS